LDLDKIEVEVSSIRKSKDDLNIFISNNTLEHNETQIKKKKKTKKSKCDAVIIEYLPEVFKKLRSLDEYEGEELY
jgi:hypothetical protein